MPNQNKEFTISGGRAQGASINYVAGEKLEITGPVSTAPSADINHLVQIQSTAGTKKLVICGGCAQGATMKFEDMMSLRKSNAEAKAVSTGDAIGGNITDNNNNLEVTDGQVRGANVDPENMRELAKFMKVKTVVVKQATAQGAVVTGTYEREGNESDTTLGEGNESDTTLGEGNESGTTEREGDWIVL